MATAIGELKKNGEPCYCGSPLPWHLHAIGDVRFSHTCPKGHHWAWSAEGFSYNGIRRNPIAEHDDAQARRTN